MRRGRDSFKNKTGNQFSLSLAYRDSVLYIRDHFLRVEGNNSSDRSLYSVRHSYVVSKGFFFLVCTLPTVGGRVHQANHEVHILPCTKVAARPSAVPSQRPVDGPHRLGAIAQLARRTHTAALVVTERGYQLGLHERGTYCMCSTLY